MAHFVNAFSSPYHFKNVFLGADKVQFKSVGLSVKGQITQITFLKIERARLDMKTAPNLEPPKHVVSANWPKLETGQQKRATSTART